MDIMNLNKALNILGLDRNYTEEDLKKAYRRTIIKYHPDKWIGKSETEKKTAEEKAKEINAAREFLEKNKEKRKTTTNNNSNHNNAAYNYIVFLRAKTNFNEALNNYNQQLRNLTYKTNLSIINKTIEKLLKINHIYIITINQTNNLTSLNNKIIEYKAVICKELEEFTATYCKEFNIKTDTSKLEKHSLKKLYEELEKIRKEQKQNNSILDTIEEDYKLYVGYEVIKENINKIKKQLLNEYKEGLYNEEEVKNRFKTKILLEFKEYHRRLEIINHIKSLGYKDKEIKAIIALMEEDITKNKDTFKKYEKILTNIIAEKETRKKPKKNNKFIKYKRKITI